MAVTPQTLRQLADTTDPALPSAFGDFVVEARALALDRDLDLARALTIARDVARARDLDLARALGLARDLARALARDPDLARARYLAGMTDELVIGVNGAPRAELVLLDMTATVIYVLLGVPYELSRDEPTGSPERQPDAPGAVPLSDMLSLTVNPDPPSDKVASFQGRVEALLGQAQRLIDEGAFDSDPIRLGLVERDRNFIRDEVYGTDEPFQLGETLGTIMARLEENLLSVSGLPGPAHALLDRVIDTTSRDSSAIVADVLDDVIDEARLDDPEWLAEQTEFDAYALQIQEIAEIGARRWIVSLADWWPTPEAAAIRTEAAIGATVGATGGGFIGLIVAAFTRASLGDAVAAGSFGVGVAGAILAASLTWYFARYRNEPPDPPKPEPDE